MGEQQAQKRAKWIPFFNIIDKVSDICITATLIMVLVVVMTQILGRLISMPVPWTEEVSRYAFIWMMFIGIAVSMRRSDSARVTVLIQLFPKAGKIIAKYLYVIISIGFFIFMIIAGYQLVAQQVSMNEVGTAVLMPMWLIGISLPISGIMGILCTLGNLIIDPEILEGGNGL